ncbi:hypothetical protein F8M41_015551 [Gigaspora margarita]|uniref:Uncharacterized protein n=1 Tax=Gigaspora margarita TaxID=4874 RepID=A0A8H4ENF2_GIGMA|nr:hypothetical protein F8M41_015551 [Gigaspora margarita]
MKTGKIIYKVKSAIYSDVSKESPGVAYTWIVTNKYIKSQKDHFIYLKARIESNLKETSEAIFSSYDSVTKGIQKISTQEAQQSINNHLISFKNKLDLDIGILPTPIFVDEACRCTLKNNEIALKLYGKEMIQNSVQWSHVNNEFNEILDNCYKYSISMFESGDINNFLLFLSQIAFALVELEKYNKI